MQSNTEQIVVKKWVFHLEVVPLSVPVQNRVQLLLIVSHAAIYFNQTALRSALGVK